MIFGLTKTIRRRLAFPERVASVLRQESIHSKKSRSANYSTATHGEFGLRSNVRSNKTPRPMLARLSVHPPVDMLSDIARWPFLAERGALPSGLSAFALRADAISANVWSGMDFPQRS